MQFNEGAVVLDADEQKLGTVDRVVLDPRTKKGTHLLVKRGFLFTVDKIVPIDWVKATSEDEVYLDRTLDDPGDLPDFQEAQFVDPSKDNVEGAREDAPSIYWYPPVNYTWWGGTTAFGATPGFAYGVPPYVVETEENLPEGTVAVQEGATVLSSGGEQVGTVERLFLDPENDRVTHMLISQGWLFTERKLIPSTWISMILADEVHLGVDAETLESVPDYDEEE